MASCPPLANIVSGYQYRTFNVPVPPATWTLLIEPRTSRWQLGLFDQVGGPVSFCPSPNTPGGGHEGFFGPGFLGFTATFRDGPAALTDSWWCFYDFGGMVSVFEEWLIEG